MATKLDWEQIENRLQKYKCDYGYSFPPQLANPTITVGNYQILNGSQTSNAIFEAYKKDSVGVKDVEVLIRVYQTKDGDITQQIAEATNSQTRIGLRDLRSNDDIQKKIEQIFRDSGLFYERKRSMFATASPEKRVDSLKLGQIILAFFREEPDKAKTSSDKIFDDYYDDIFDRQFSYVQAIPIVRIFQQIERRVAIIAKANRRVGTATRNISYLYYSMFHILYAVSLIMQREGLSVEKVEQRVNQIVDEAIEIIGRVVDKTANASFYELFRNTKTKNQIAQEVFPNQLSLFASVGKKA